MNTLPSFTEPRLTEVFLAVQFDPLAKLRTPHLGEFLQAQEGWEALPDGQAIGQGYEPLGESPDWILPGLMEIGGEVEVRLRARRAEADYLLQVENGWLAFNWNKSQDRYPRYDKLREEFGSAWSRWSDYVAGHRLGELRPSLWEVGYVNVFPRGDLWSTSADWARLLPGLVSDGVSSGGLLQTLSSRWAIRLGPGWGRLQILLEHALMPGPDQNECLLLRLIARGPVQGDLMAGLDRGRAAIVRNFPEFLSIEARKQMGFQP